jgi:hypothetical protein
MSVAYTIDPDLRLVVVKAWGTLTGVELIDATDALHAMPEFTHARRELGDYRDVTEFDMDGSAIRRLAARSVFDSSVRRAVVVSADVAFGMARMYQMLREGPDDGLRVYRELDEAIAWVGLEGEKSRVLDELARLRRSG